ncbi:uncharacterized protein LOC124950916 [Vespa velutina]|uniref:uncharacterized protein LOC124950916 n=1 Tax=Vespa velutina TaxID=202808 RepID=UPI001FB39DA3|nr:uncharacterized protein LOC124950916 [Vespa velutina]
MDKVTFPKVFKLDEAREVAVEVTHSYSGIYSRIYLNALCADAHRNGFTLSQRGEDDLLEMDQRPPTQDAYLRTRLLEDRFAVDSLERRSFRCDTYTYISRYMQGPCTSLRRTIPL